MLCIYLQTCIFFHSSNEICYFIYFFFNGGCSSYERYEGFFSNVVCLFLKLIWFCCWYHMKRISDFFRYWLIINVAYRIFSEANRWTLQRSTMMTRTYKVNSFPVLKTLKKKTIFPYSNGCRQNRSYVTYCEWRGVAFFFKQKFLYKFSMMKIGWIF